MKKNLTHLFLGLGLCGTALAQTAVTGPSSSQSPYLLPVAPGTTVTSILTVTDVVSSYSMCGLADGTGAYDNGNGTFTFLMNHEMGNNVGAVRAHGSTGAFVSKWIINKSNLAVQSGADLIQNVYLWTGSTYTLHNATNPSTLAAFGRFCSADLPAVSAYYNMNSGNGTQNRIFMNGEESGAEGRAFGHIATGPAAGNTYQLPHLGRASWENAVARPYWSDKTVVALLDDATPGQVYMYIGTKTNAGTDVARAGLTNGKLYGVAVASLIAETNTSVPAANTTFSLVDLGQVQSITGASLNTASNNAGITTFLRPEDGTWDPMNPRDFYFLTTNAFNANSRMWRLRFNDVNNPEQGGTITAVLDGTEGQQMMDNMDIDNLGQIIIQEDVGNQAHLGKMWNYNIATDQLTQLLTHDANRFVTAAPNFLTQDEEASGIIDMQAILGPGMFLFVDQAHYSVPTPFVEGGQILAVYSPFSAAANPEINVQGNSVSITDGDLTPATTDNTSFGMVNVGGTITKQFVIQNAGPGVLTITTFSIGGVNAGDFTLLSPPTLPATLAVSGSQTITVQFSAILTGTRNAVVSVFSNDYSESVYDFAVQAEGVVPEINLQGNSISIVDGSNTTSTTNNTDFGSTIYNNPVTKTFVIQNTGNGTLTVSSWSVSGAQASEFTMINAPALPFNLAGNASQTFTVQFLPTAVGTRSAMVSITSTDSDESVYNYNVSGIALLDVGVAERATGTSLVSLYPNPAKDEVTVKLNLGQDALVAVTVLDITGKVVMATITKDLAKGERELNIRTAGLANGEYFVQVRSGNNTNSLKMVVAH